MNDKINDSEHTDECAVTIQQTDKVFLKHLETVKGQESYQNQRFIGRGGNGTAFLVTSMSGKLAGIQMVLKILHNKKDPKREEDFRNEISTLKTLDHPGIVRIFDDGEHETAAGIHPFLVYEYMPQTVRQLLVSDEVDRLRAIRIVLNCLSALQAMHEPPRMIVHRDIKPENIFFGESGARIGDFGLAKHLSDVIDDLSPNTVLESSKLVVDTDIAKQEDADLIRSVGPRMPKFYRTPELIAIAQGENVTLTPASDIYQLGTVFYELLTGWNPQNPPQSKIDSIQLSLRDIWGGQGTELLALIKDMLKQNAADRPTTHDCLNRLLDIHTAYCKQLARALGNSC